MEPHIQTVRLTGAILLVALSMIVGSISLLKAVDGPKVCWVTFVHGMTWNVIALVAVMLLIFR